MRILITGSRKWRNRLKVYSVLAEYRKKHPDMTVITGGCNTGADYHAANWASRTGTCLFKIKARWHLFGHAAGPKRNQELVDTEPDLCIAFLRPDSKGTIDCLRKASDAQIPLEIHYEDFDGYELKDFQIMKIKD